MSQRIVLVTGATSGIGLSAVERLAASDWRVWVAGRDLRKAEEVAARIGGRAVQLDVTDATSIAAAVETVGELDTLVNNAGVQPDFGISLLEADAAVSGRRTRPTCSAWSR